MASQQSSLAPAAGDATAIPLSDDERKVLALYDRVGEQQVEIALLKAQISAEHGPLNSLVVS